MFILFKLVLYSFFAECCIFLHLLYYFIVDRHSMKANDQTYYFWFYCFDIFKKL